MLDVDLPHAGTVATKRVWTSGPLFVCEFESLISPAGLAAAQLRGDTAPAMAGEAKLQNEAIATSGAFDRFGANLKRLRIAKRSEAHTSELQSLMRNSYAVFRCKKNQGKHAARKTEPPTQCDRQTPRLNSQHSYDIHYLPPTVT